MTARADRGKSLAGRLRDRIGCIDGWYNDASGELVSPLTEIAADVAELEAENARLRELLRHMYECMGNIDADGNYECDSCEYDNDEGACDYERLMEEMGIEVDG